LTAPQSTILLIVAAIFALLAYGRWRYDIVAALALLIAVLAGLVPAARAFDGFADPAVATLALLLVISAAIRNSGALEFAIGPLSPFLRWTAARVAVLGAIAAAASAFMNNAAVLAVVLPAALQASQRHRQSPTPVLLPIAMLSGLGGLATLVGTLPNLLVSGVRQRTLGQGYSVFDFAAVGAPLALAALIVLPIAWRLLPRRRPGRMGAQDLVAVEGYTSEVLVPLGSSVAGQSVRLLEARSEGVVKVKAIIREEHRRVAPRADWVIEPDDVLVLACEPDTLQRLMEQAGLRIVGGAGGDVDPERVGVLEAVVTPGSELVGRSPGESGFDRRFRISLLAIGRSGGQPPIRLRRMKLRAGDVLVLQGELDALPATLAGLGCLPLAERRLRLGRRRQVFTPVALLGAAIALAASGLLPVAIALLCAVLVLVLFRILTLNELYAAVPWPVVVLVGALLPISVAFQGTGAAALIAGWVGIGTAGLPVAAVLLLVLVATLLMAQLFTGAASVLVAAPVAAALAAQGGISVDPFLMAVAVGGSCEAVALVGRQSTLALLGAGGHSSKDLWRLGVPLAALVALGGVAGILLAWPLR